MSGICGISALTSAPSAACLSLLLMGRHRFRLSQLATIRMLSGPSMIRNEEGMLTGYVYVDIADRDPSSYIEEAGMLLREKIKVPPAMP